MQLRIVFWRLAWSSSFDLHVWCVAEADCFRGQMLLSRSEHLDFLHRNHMLKRTSKVFLSHYRDVRKMHQILEPKKRHHLHQLRGVQTQLGALRRPRLNAEIRSHNSMNSNTSNNSSNKNSNNSSNNNDNRNLKRRTPNQASHVENHGWLFQGWQFQ